jgi:hypothetical protein
MRLSMDAANPGAGGESPTTIRWPLPSIASFAAMQRFGRFRPVRTSDGGLATTVSVEK